MTTSALGNFVVIEALSPEALAHIAGGMTDLYSGEQHPGARVPGRLTPDPDEDQTIAGAGQWVQFYY